MDDITNGTGSQCTPLRHEDTLGDLAWVMTTILASVSVAALVILGKFLMA